MALDENLPFSVPLLGVSHSLKSSMRLSVCKGRERERDDVRIIKKGIGQFGQIIRVPILTICPNEGHHDPCIIFIG